MPSRSRESSPISNNIETSLTKTENGWERKPLSASQKAAIERAEIDDNKLTKMALEEFQKKHENKSSEQSVFKRLDLPTPTIQVPVDAWEQAEQARRQQEAERAREKRKALKEQEKELSAQTQRDKEEREALARSARESLMKKREGAG